VNILPGVQGRYSGGGITVGQLLVTDIFGKPLPALMRALVLDPLGMVDRTYEQPLPSERAGAAATAHPSKGRPLAGRWHVYPEMAAAGLWTAPSDLARAGIEVQRALQGEGTAVISPATAKAMLTPGAASDEVGLGFFLEGKDAAGRFGHGGWDEGFVAQMTFYKNRGQGAVVMVNSNEGFPLLEEILRAVAREYAWPGYFRDETTASVAAATLEAYAGSYAAESFECSVARKGDHLFLKLGNEPALELRPTTENAFQAVEVDAEVAFNKVEGLVKSLTLTQDGKGTTAERK
jgi:CubicO group peptidase (beta-lactamase class C family)